MRKAILLLLLISGLVVKPFKSSAQANIYSLMLVNLYDSTNGPGWTKSTHWLTGDISRWYGITASGSIQDIELPSNNLVGVIPSTLGNDSFLVFLNLSHNQLTGTIPFSLTVLDRDSLLLLNLSYNNLSGSIPSSIGNDSVLTYLDLSHNQFTFAGMEAVAKLSPPAWGYLSYAPQANIPVVEENGKLWVSAGGTLSNNTYKWYNGNTLMATITGDSTFVPTAGGSYSVTVTNAIAKQLTLYSDTITPALITIQTCENYGADTLISNVSGKSYQWQKNNGSGFVNTGSAEPYPQLFLIYFPPYVAQNGVQYRCIVDGKDTSQLYTTEVIDTWTGSVSSAWEDSRNWACGFTPDTFANVYINSGTPPAILSSNTTIKSITVSPNASFTIVSPYNLTVTQ